MFSRQQILHSIISDGQHMLEHGQVDDRWIYFIKRVWLAIIEVHIVYEIHNVSHVHIVHEIHNVSNPYVYRDEFKLKLALLSNQWQGVVRRAQQRKGIIDSLLRQWQRYREMLEKLRKWLAEISQQSDILQSGSTVLLQQARAMLDAVQVTRTIFYDAHCFYTALQVIFIISS